MTFLTRWHQPYPYIENAFIGFSHSSKTVPCYMEISQASDLQKATSWATGLTFMEISLALEVAPDHPDWNSKSGDNSQVVANFYRLSPEQLKSLARHYTGFYAIDTDACHYGKNWTVAQGLALPIPLNWHSIVIATEVISRLINTFSAKTAKSIKSVAEAFPK